MPDVKMFINYFLGMQSYLYTYTVTVCFYNASFLSQLIGFTQVATATIFKSNWVVNLVRSKILKKKADFDRLKEQR